MFYTNRLASVLPEDRVVICHGRDEADKAEELLPPEGWIVVGFDSPNNAAWYHLEFITNPIILWVADKEICKKAWMNLECVAQTQFYICNSTKGPSDIVDAMMAEIVKFLGRYSVMSDEGKWYD